MGFECQITEPTTCWGPCGVSVSWRLEDFNFGVLYMPAGRGFTGGGFGAKEEHPSVSSPVSLPESLWRLVPVRFCFSEGNLGMSYLNSLLLLQNCVSVVIVVVDSNGSEYWWLDGILVILTRMRMMRMELRWDD